RINELTRQLEEDRRKWSTVTANYTQLIARVDSMETKLDRILSALDPSQNSAVTTSQLPSQESAARSNNKRSQDSADEPEPSVTPSPVMASNKMDTVAQLQLQINAMIQEREGEQRKVAQLEELVNHYRKDAEERQAYMESIAQAQREFKDSNMSDHDL
ncbi:hypothetical protein BGZ50_001500, partial [Haplosporangium sp. Z 11]